MKYTEMMDAVKNLGLRFTVSPEAGFITVSLINTECLSVATSNIGWYSFRDNPIESFILVYQQYSLSQKLPSVNGIVQ